MRPKAEWPKWVRLADMSRLLDVSPQTPYQWRARAGTMRDPLPPPDIDAPGAPLWKPDTIRVWWDGRPNQIELIPGAEEMDAS